jgi:hypothetical protein
MPEIACRQFGDILSRRSEHLEDEILKDMHPVGTMIGMVETGQFPSNAGVSHTFDRFNHVHPDLSGDWLDVNPQSCIGTPCHPEETLVGMGFTRDEYHLTQKSFKTDLFCWDQIMSADRAIEQFSHFVDTLRRTTDLVVSDRHRVDMFRIAGHHWFADLDGNTPFTFTDSNNLTDVVLTSGGVPNALPTSKLMAAHLNQRIQYQLLTGATMANTNKGQHIEGTAPVLEVLGDWELIQHMVRRDPVLIDAWRITNFDQGAKEFYKFGWAGQVGPFMVKADLTPLRFQVLPNGHLQRVFSHYNVPATRGIREIVNPAYLNAPIGVAYIWHRRAMKVLTRETKSLNPNMPFAVRDFGGKWQFVMDNLTCGYQTVTNSSGELVRIPIAVDNARRNQGQFLADFSFATKAQYPEFAEVFLYLREPVPIIGEAPCTTSTYVTQDYSSSNDPCE